MNLFENILACYRAMQEHRPFCFVTLRYNAYQRSIVFGGEHA